MKIKEERCIACANNIPDDIEFCWICWRELSDAEKKRIRFNDFEKWLDQFDLN